MPDRTVLITGANGFLGRQLCYLFSRQGWRVRALVRNPLQTSIAGVDSTEMYRFDLEGTVDEAAFLGMPDTLIHCAWELDPASTACNLSGTQLLTSLARAHESCQLIFISTLSAHDEAESAYGVTKLAAEGEFNQPGDLIVRPGLIIGEGGLFQRMMLGIKRSPVIPLFYGGHQQIQYISAVQLCKGVFNAVESRMPGCLNVAYPIPLDIRAFYSVCAESLGKKARFLSLPGSPIQMTLRAIESHLRRKLPVTSENLAGLKKMRTFPTAADLEKLGIEAEDLGTILASLRRA